MSRRGDEGTERRESEGLLERAPGVSGDLLVGEAVAAGATPSELSKIEE